MSANIRILIVNNNETSPETLTTILAGQKISNVVTVTTAKEALKAFINDKDTHPFDVAMICDLSNNEEIELLTSLLEIDPELYAIMLSDNLSADKVLNFVRHGATGIIAKPYSGDKLRLELEKYKMLHDKKAIAS